MLSLSPATTSAFLAYLAVVLAIGFYAYLKTSDAADYFLGGRQLSPAVSAISAGASDMSGWILLGLPGYAYLSGLEAIWISVGLCLGVAVNWLVVARRLRTFSVELDDAVTIPVYFQRRFAGSSRWLRPVSAVAILLFFLFYVSSGLIGGGKLFNSVFGVNYQVAVFVGVGVILLYTLFGGFLAVSWTDVFQGLLMILALAIAPALVLSGSGGVEGFSQVVVAKNAYLMDAFTDSAGQPLGAMALISLLGWGLGYFGQPHILARFKAIRSVNDIGQAAVIGILWAVIGYFLAIMVGLSGLVYLADPLVDSERVFIVLTSLLFNPWVAGILLAAILAAIMSTVDSQLLVCSSALAEDLYPMITGKPLSPQQRLQAGRIAVVALALLATLFALNPDSKVLDVVAYAWAGLGASLGPAMLISLYWKKMTGRGALAGVVTGGVTVIVWAQLSGGLFDLYELVPGFLFSALAVYLFSITDSTAQQRSGEVFDRLSGHL